MFFCNVWDLVLGGIIGIIEFDIMWLLSIFLVLFFFVIFGINIIFVWFVWFFIKVDRSIICNEEYCNDKKYLLKILIYERKIYY